MADDKKRVKFTGDCGNDEDREEREDIILAQPHSENVFTVRLGYIKIFHRYRVFFSIPKELLKVSGLSLPENEDPNPRCLFIRYKDVPSGVHVEAELYAEVERSFEEPMILNAFQAEPSFSKITVLFFASVFGKHEGTPRLKRGVRCVGYFNDSSSSDDD